MAYLFQNVDGTEPISDTDGELKANVHLYGVISGCGVTADTGDMTVDDAAGSILHNGSTVAVAGGTDSWTLVSDPSNPRFSWLAYSSAGAAQLVSGDASADPIVPEIGDRVANQLVYIPANETLASNCTFIDKRIPAHIPPGSTLVASSDTPVSTTSTSATDFVTISSLNIPVTSKVIFEWGYSKDALAAQNVRTGFKVNSTEIIAAASGANTTTTQQVEQGVARVELSPRSADHLNGMLFTYFSRVGSTGAAGIAWTAATVGAPLPNAAITTLIINGINATSNNNLTVEWYRVWELPV